VSGNTDVNQRDLNPETLHRTMKYTTDMAMEMHNLATGNPVAKLMSVKAMEDEIGDPFDAIDGHYIRMERGELGLVEMSRMAGWFQGLKESAIKVAIRGADQLGRN
jgi:hypothetical protein